MGELDGIELLDARQLLHQDTTQLQLGVFGDGRVLAEPFQQRVIKFDPTVCTETVGFFCAAFTKTTLVI
jgi:hypothetical protein